MITKPRKYQIDGYRNLNKFRGRALLADEMGLGKTYQVLLWLYKHKKIRPCIIICPSGLKYNWQREAKNHFGLDSYVIEGTKSEPLNLQCGLVIINYKILVNWTPYLFRLDYKCVVVDECHHISNRTTIRTKETKKICRKAKYRIALSGTPQTNRPSELWSVLNLIDPDYFNSFFSFAHNFCKPQRKPWGWEFKGAKNVGKLHKQLKDRCMIRRLKKDVASELPKKVRNIVPLKIRKEKEYNQAADDFINWLQKKSPAKAIKAKRAKAIVKMGYLKRLAARLKMKAVCDWVNEFLENSEDKLVLFGVHKKAIKLLRNRFEKTSLVIDGSVSSSKRQEIVDDFQNGDKRILIGNIKAAGVGITLTAASTLAFFELGWTPAEHTQAEDRIHRIGQDKVSMIYYLIAMDTIEEKLCDLIQEKQIVQNAVLDGGKSQDDLEIYDLLMHRMDNQD